MKLTLKDFGPIDEFTLDLSKDIQFIYGENSVGKSYAVFVLYALSEAFEHFRGLDKGVHNNERLSIESKIDDFHFFLQNTAKENEGKRVNINQYIENLLQNLTNQSTRTLEKILLTKFSSLSEFSNVKTKNDFSVNLDFSNITLRFAQSQSTLLGRDLVSKIILSENREVLYDKNKNKFTYYCDGREEDTFSGKIKGDTNFDWVFRSLIQVLFFQKINKFLRKTYLIPANRTGTYLSTNSFAPIIAELSTNRVFLEHNKSIELAAFSKEIADYIIHFSLMDSRNSGELLMPFVRKLEKNILKGKIEFDDQRKRITYHPDGTDLALDLLAASSMIAEISIITAFFKYNIKDNGLQNKINKIVIIEEPESHLHPKTQVALMELFAELPKYGIKLIVTSHSDFMMDKLSNMILEGKVDADTVGSYRMVMGEKGSYDAGDMKASKDGIPDKNFVAISEKLYEERVDIYDQLNEKNAATEYNKS